MYVKNALKQYFLVFGVPILLFLFLIFFSNTSIFNANNKLLAIGLTLDLILTIPLVYYLLIRTKKIPKTTIVPVFVIGMLIGTYIIPKEQQELLNFIKTWIFPFVELSIIAYVIYSIKKTVHRYKTHYTNADFFSNLKQYCTTIAPKKLGHFLATEIATFYYTFVLWKTTVPKENEFTYHKNGNINSTFIGFIIVIAIEAVALHFLMLKWNAPITITWIITGLSCYTGVQFLGFSKANNHRFTCIDANTLLLRFGILSEAEITIDQISSIEISTKDLNSDTTTTLSPLGELTEHNIILHLKKPHILTGFYGIKKKYQSIAFYIDDKKRFKQHIEQNTAYQS